jgi:hypothetical protein
MLLLVMASASFGARGKEQVGTIARGDTWRSPHVAALVRAACEGDAADVEREIASGADPNDGGEEDSSEM